MVCEGTITSSDIEDAKSSKGNKVISIGLPAFCILETLLRSAKANSVGLLLGKYLICHEPLPYSSIISVRSHVDWRGERNISYKGVETSSYHTGFKNLEVKPERESPKRTVFASCGSGLLQMVSESNTGQCASEDVGPREGWIVRSHIG